MNPCPCGYYGDPIKPCTCAPSTVTKYQKRISGPLLDRIDIHVEVPRVDYQKLSDDRLGEPSEAIRRRVESAREVQRKRFGENRESTPPKSGQVTESRESQVKSQKRTHDYRMSSLDSRMVCNADMRVAEIRQHCKLDGAGEGLSARGYHRVLKLARTIADLAGCVNIQAAHLAPLRGLNSGAAIQAENYTEAVSHQQTAFSLEKET